MLLSDGTLCDLPGLITLKKKYKIKLIIDESLSLGSVGLHGVVDYFNNKKVTETSTITYSLTDLDIVMGSLELTVGSIGGFCCTNQDLARHLHLFSPGYCFSAAAPAVAAIWAAEILDKHLGTSATEVRFDRLQQNVSNFHNQITSNRVIQEKFQVDGDHFLVYLRPNNCERITVDDYINILKQIQERMHFKIDIWSCPSVQRSLEEYLGIVTPPPVPALRVSINCLHSRENISEYIESIAAASEDIVATPNVRTDSYSSMESSIRLHQTLAISIEG